MYRIRFKSYKYTQWRIQKSYKEGKGDFIVQAKNKKDLYYCFNFNLFFGYLISIRNAYIQYKINKTENFKIGRGNLPITPLLRRATVPVKPKIFYKIIIG